MNNVNEKCRISIDGEMLGGVPGHFSMVEIGACTLQPLETMKKFGGIIRPSLGVSEPFEHGSKQVLRRSFDYYVEHGKDPRTVAHDFVDFCDEVRQGRLIEISGVNIAFDFGFFREFLRRFCPDRYEVIGYKAYDITSYACGVFGVPLGSMSAKKAWARILGGHPDIHKRYCRGDLEHTAMQDSVDQACLQMALEEVQSRMMANVISALGT